MGVKYSSISLMASHWKKTTKTYSKVSNTSLMGCCLYFPDDEVVLPNRTATLLTHTSNETCDNSVTAVSNASFKSLETGHFKCNQLNDSSCCLWLDTSGRAMVRGKKSASLQISYQTYMEMKYQFKVPKISIKWIKWITGFKYESSRGRYCDSLLLK